MLPSKAKYWPHSTFIFREYVLVGPWYVNFWPLVKIIASLTIRYKSQLYKILMESEHGRQDYHSFKEIWPHYICFGQPPLVPRKTANPVQAVSANSWSPERNVAIICAWTSPGILSLYCRSPIQRILCSLCAVIWTQKVRCD